MSRKHVKVTDIKSDIVERQTRSQAIRRSIRTSRGLVRWGFWEDKRALGADTRHVLLAYAFLRGMPYLACEKNTEKPVSIEPIADYARKFARDVEPTNDQVRIWLLALAEKEVAA